MTAASAAQSIPTPLVEASDVATRRRRRRGWLVSGWLLVLMFVNWGDKGVLGLAAGPIMRDLHLTPEQFGFVGSSLFFLFSASMIGVGLIANRVQTRWILAIMAILWSVAQIPLLLVATLPALLFSRILLGAAEGPTAPIQLHAIYKLFPDKERTLPAAVSQAGAMLGLAVAGPVLTYIIVNHGWRSAFAVLAVAGVVWTAVWLVIGRDGPLDDQTERKQAGTVVPSSAEPRIPYRRMLASGTWLGSVLGTHFGYWALAISTAWLPIYLEKVVGYSPITTGSLVALPPLIGGALGTIATNGFSGWLVRRGVATRWARGVLQGSIVAIGGISLAALPFVAGGPWLIVLMILAFGLPYASFPLAGLTTAEISPIRQRSGMLGFTDGVLTCAGLFAPSVVGLLVGAATTQAAGFQDAFVLVGVMMTVAGGIACLIIRPQHDARRLGLHR